MQYLQRSTLLPGSVLMLVASGGPIETRVHRIRPVVHALLAGGLLGLESAAARSHGAGFGF